MAKVGKLLEINQDLIKAREEDLEKLGPATDDGNQNQAPKVVMQVNRGNDLRLTVKNMKLNLFKGNTRIGS